jgi:hypothetical protein
VTWKELIVLIGEIAVLLGALIPVIVFIMKLVASAKCQLRSEMLRIYYNNKPAKTIHQFEYENFAMLYKAYKALGGNSFIDKIWREIQSWEIEDERDVEP